MSSRARNLALAVVLAAGAWMGVYDLAPFRVLPRALRTRLVRGLARALPRLFGCQMVVRSTPV